MQQVDQRNFTNAQKAEHKLFRKTASRSVMYPILGRSRATANSNATMDSSIVNISSGKNIFQT
jgi:hypothetical protein